MIAILTSLLLALSPTPQNVSLRVTSTADREALIYLAVFRNAEDFAADKEVIGRIEPMSDRKANVEVELPDAGKYVFAAFHDLNDNGELDLNFFGVPTEPYGFTRKPPSKWRAPSFSEVATEVEAGSSATIELKLWGEH